MMVKYQNAEGVLCTGDDDGITMGDIAFKVERTGGRTCLVARLTRWGVDCGLALSSDKFKSIAGGKRILFGAIQIGIASARAKRVREGLPV